MWTALKWAVRVAVLAALFVGYKAVTFEPLLRALAAELPEPTKFSRPPDAYDWKTFGAPIKAGFSKRDITPKETLVWLAGYYPPHPKTSIHDQIWVKSLALQDDHGQIAVFVSVDLIGLLPDEIAKIKHGALGIVNEYRMFISCTHTHSGPDTMGLWGPPPFTGKRRNYQKFMREEIIASIKEAVLNLQDAKIRFGGADFPNYAGGRHENPNDPSVSVLQVLFSNTGPVTLVNYACHADVAMTMQMTADFPYYLYERLGRLTGGEVMYIPGAIGGVQPRKNGFETWPYFVRTLGENLADFVHFQIMKNPIAPKWIQIGVTRTEVKSPMENENFNFAARMGMIADVRNDRGAVVAEINRIVIGPMEILTVPGELFPKSWWNVKPLMKGKLKAIFGLTNGEYGYILLPEDYYSGKHNYHVSVSVGHNFGLEIEKAMKKLVTAK